MVALLARNLAGETMPVSVQFTEPISDADLTGAITTIEAQRRGRAALGDEPEDQIRMAVRLAATQTSGGKLLRAVAHFTHRESREPKGTEIRALMGNVNGQMQSLNAWAKARGLRKLVENEYHADSATPVYRMRPAVVRAVLAELDDAGRPR
jgi:hypothetical protein